MSQYAYIHLFQDFFLTYHYFTHFYLIYVLFLQLDAPDKIQT